jgi:hypothetical protein
VNATEAELKISAALAALETHWAGCCRASAAHYLDDADLCEKGKALYKVFWDAECAYRMASWGDTLPLMADRDLPPAPAGGAAGNDGRMPRSNREVNPGQTPRQAGLKPGELPPDGELVADALHGAAPTVVSEGALT